MPEYSLRETNGRKPSKKLNKDEAVKNGGIHHRSECQRLSPTKPYTGSSEPSFQRGPALGPVFSQSDPAVARIFSISLARTAPPPPLISDHPQYGKIPHPSLLMSNWPGLSSSKIVLSRVSKNPLDPCCLLAEIFPFPAFAPWLPSPS